MTREEREKAIEIIRKYECNTEHYEACEAIIKELEQEQLVLDKVRADIEKLDYVSVEDGSDGYDKYIEQYEVIKIIDKYKAESEE